MCKNNAQNHLMVADSQMSKAEKYAYMFDVEVDANKEVIEMSDIIFLTVKPDQISTVCEEINDYSLYEKILVSVAAGVPISKISDWTLNRHQIVRCMPNIPISISEGSILWHSECLDTNDKELINIITEGPFNMWLDHEELIDAGTVLSGCSPAYMAKIYQIYLDVGKELGFSSAQSRKLLHNSFAGTIKLLLHNTPVYLMDQVASKGGVAEKSLEIMEEKGLKDIIKQSVHYSLDRIKSIREKV